MPQVFTRAYLPGAFLHQFFPWRAAAAETPAYVDSGNRFLRDVVTIYQPQDILLHRELSQGRLPLWDPTAFSGHPLQAGGQVAMLYPPKLLLAWLLSPEPAHNAYLFLHLGAAAAMAFLFFRRLTGDETAALLGALWWVFSGVVMVRLEASPFLPYALWLPAGLWASDRLRSQPCARNAGLLALTVTLTFSAGHLQMAMYCLLLLVSWGLLKPTRRAVAWGVAAVVLGLAGAAATLLPSWELAKLSGRPVYSYAEHFSANCFRSEQLATLLSPEYLGSAPAPCYLTRNPSPVQNPLELAAHVGVTATGLALAALALRRREVWFFAAWAALALTTAAGWPTWHVLAAVIPGFAQLTVSRILWIFSFALIALATLGLSSPRRGVGLAVTLALTLLVTLVAASGPPLSLLGSAEADRPNYCTGKQFAAVVEPWLHSHYRLGNLVLWIPVVTGLVALAGLRTRRLALLLVLLLPWDCLAFAWRWNVTTAFGATYPPLPALQRLQEARRIVGVGGVAQPDSLTAYGIRDAGGYDSLFPLQYRYVFEQWRGEPLQQVTVLYLSGNSPLLRRWADVLGVEVLYTDPLGTAAPPPPGPELYRGELVLYQNPSATPYEYRVSQWRMAATQGEALAAVAEPSFQVGREAVVEGLPQGKGTLLVRNEQFYPGWKCKVDGQPNRIYRANACLQGVLLEPGEHKVEFVFWPDLLQWGLAVSAGALALTGMLAAVRPGRREPRP